MTLSAPPSCSQWFRPGESGFPARLSAIPKPVPRLFIRHAGTEAAREDLFRRAAVALIGTREPCESSLRVTGWLARAAVDAGLVVISGLAKGIDAAAHAGCLRHGGATVAVLAHGLDQPPYPRENRDLAAQILESGGAWVSEYPDGTKLLPYRLFERDRIQSGLSDGVLVVEAGAKSGTMHTAGFARAQGRRLACIDPALITGLNDAERAQRFAGNTTLLDSGAATPIRDKSDLLGFYASCVPSQGAFEASLQLSNRGETPDLFQDIPGFETKEPHDRVVAGRLRP